MNNAFTILLQIERSFRFESSFPAIIFHALMYERENDTTFLVQAVAY